MSRALLMIPGPIEVSEEVARHLGVLPTSHMGPDCVDAFARALGRMRDVWRASEHAQPFIVAGGGTLAMESCVANLVDANRRVLVLSTGYFGQRFAEMVRRRGAALEVLESPVGAAPSAQDVADELERASQDKRAFDVVLMTHVDTSTGVRIDTESVLAAVRASGALSVVDGVCSLGGEALEMEDWGADVVLTASQKAIGAPAGLGLWIAGPRALEARERLGTPPPLTLDWKEWLPIMHGYESKSPKYFATPATTLVDALARSLEEIAPHASDASTAMRSRWELHDRAARAMRAGFEALSLSHVVKVADHRANTLSAIELPSGLEPGLPQRVAKHGVIIAGGLHPALRTTTFRVGHMGVVVGEPARLEQTLTAVAKGLAEGGHACAADDAVRAFRAVYGR